MPSRDTPPPLKPLQKESAGPIVGAIVIIILLVIGGFYFWGARLNHRSPQDQLPFIVGDTSTTTIE